MTVFGLNQFVNTMPIAVEAVGLGIYVVVRNINWVLVGV